MYLERGNAKNNLHKVNDILWISLTLTPLKCIFASIWVTFEDCVDGICKLISTESKIYVN